MSKFFCSQFHFAVLIGLLSLCHLRSSATDVAAADNPPAIAAHPNDDQGDKVASNVVSGGVDVDKGGPSDSLRAPSSSTTTALGLDRDVTWRRGIQGALCGPFSAYAAMQRLGANVTPRSYIKAKYVGGCGGSTESEIVATIEDTGFAAYPANGLSILDLKTADLPFIAFVRPNAGSDRYNHWITTVEQNVKGKGFLVFDNGLPPYTISEAEQNRFAVGAVSTRD